MLMKWKNSNDLTKYCAASSCEKTETQKKLKRFNTTGNTTQLSKAMRYAEYVRQYSKTNIVNQNG
jgi:hypothetical protein